jgi:hypothetical protein
MVGMALWADINTMEGYTISHPSQRLHDVAQSLGSQCARIFPPCFCRTPCDLILSQFPDRELGQNDNLDPLDMIYVILDYVKATFDPYHLNITGDAITYTFITYNVCFHHTIIMGLTHAKPISRVLLALYRRTFQTHVTGWEP